MDILAQPIFNVEEGAPPGTGAAFRELLTIVAEQPAEVPAVFDSLGHTVDEIAAAKDALAEDDTTLSARVGRLAATILYQQFDLKVEFSEAVDAALRSELVRSREKMSAAARRVRRISLFVGEAAAMALQPEDVAEAA